MNRERKKKGAVFLCHFVLHFVAMGDFQLLFLLGQREREREREREGEGSSKGSIPRSVESEQPCLTRSSDYLPN